MDTVNDNYKSSDLEKALKSLSEIRKVFHSEADFQFAYAWQLKECFQDAEVRLEFPICHNGASKRLYLDLLLTINGIRYGVELKYKTRLLNLELNGEWYGLKNQSAQDCGRYDFMFDLQRLESFVINDNIDRGIAVFLTNDAGYTSESNNATVDEQFRIHDNRVIHSNTRLDWRYDASAGTKRGRENSIMLKKDYILKWEDFSYVSDGSKLNNGSFKYLFVDVSSRTQRK